MASIELIDLLKQKIGLDSTSIGPAAIERALQMRMSACKSQHEQEYLELLLVKDGELQELIEAVVVPETWFFRDPEAFAAMTRLVHEEWLPSHPEGMLRVLSLPCSTGEEPYSIAMALLDAGIPAKRFLIDAVDVSERVLQLAQRALYGRNSFRGKDLRFRDCYFEAQANEYRLSKMVRQQVRFQRANLFEADFLPGSAIYDIIYCRNLLIYFDSATQKRAIQILTRLLATKGFLFLGPSETSLAPPSDFVSLRIPMAFGFRRVLDVPQSPKTKHAHPPKKSADSGSRRVAGTSRPPAPVAHRPAAAAARPQPASQRSHLEEAQRLADRGLLSEAIKHCEDHLRHEGPSAQAYYLLGLIEDAKGKSAEAKDAYRKALYLNPNHYEALVHLALLLENQKDMAGAETLNARARRLLQRTSQ